MTKFMYTEKFVCVMTGRKTPFNTNEEAKALFESGVMHRWKRLLRHL